MICRESWLSRWIHEENLGSADGFQKLWIWNVQTQYNSESDSAEIYDNTGKLVYRLEK